jgi:hypothetical protein
MFDFNKTHEELREELEWGNSFNANMERLPETKYLKIKELSDGHLLTLSTFLPENQPYHAVFRNELNYRESKGISVAEYKD